jgi:hypothetical protein
VSFILAEGRQEPILSIQREVIRYWQQSGIIQIINITSKKSSMKQISISIFFIIYFISIHAQDTINLKNKKVIHAYITEKSDTKIKYKTDSIHAYTTYSTNLSKVKTIHYGNGEVDLLSSQNPRSIFPVGIDVGYGVPMFLVSIDYFVTPNLSTEINFKYMHYYKYRNTFSVGGKYWFANKYGKSGFSPFAGLFFTKWSIRNDYEDRYNRPEWSVHYLPEVPIGISYITKFGFQTSLQLDNHLYSVLNKLVILPECIELRIGWRFKTSK